MTRPKSALVTGGSQGIGQACVAALLDAGWRVAALSRDEGRLAALAASTPEPTRERLTTIPADVSREADVDRAVAAAAERLGGLDALVNSAGVSMRANRRLADSDPAEWRRIVDINLTGTYLMCRAALPHLERSDEATVVNIQSTASYAAKPTVGVYAASKFGVRALTESLIEEYQGSNVRVTAVSPGAVDTTIWTHKAEPPDDARRATMIRASDIAEIVLWLIERPARLHIPNITVTPTRWGRP
ncbi:SDR family oxidoreductase [Alsobacter sp. SYSU M60028]|uniref:SDR family oxidoreductase n=1 Tax=Alsobacter ponti TaxID=2962936 RepID=A0ABT1LBI9_9HYPH|nr:SDR family oxidoreductase [Alsobacter ponti]MCP8938331.1 SDR family oxidoreductase [Alsobacter ponti]